MDIHTHFGNLYDDTNEIMTLILPETLNFTNFQHGYNFKCMYFQLKLINWNYSLPN